MDELKRNIMNNYGMKQNFSHIIPMKCDKILSAKV